MGDLAKEMMRAAVAHVAKEMRNRLSAIRHPETGEFPAVVVEGEQLDDMAFRVEGSEALLEIVKARLLPEELELMKFVATDAANPPRAFLSYGWEDRELAKKIAEGLQSNGIETWWAEWKIGAGDSIRRKIDTGLGSCTHFIVLLTPTSIIRPWVNEEIDAAYMRRINSKSRFIPLRHGLALNKLPPLMSGMFSPEVNADASDLQQLINDIHGLSLTPPLGAAPGPAAMPSTGYSSAATAIAHLFVMSSENGLFAEPQFSIEEIAELTRLSEDDVTDALHELRHYLKESFNQVLVDDTLYAEFDRYWQPWDPPKDALKLAADLVNDANFPGAPAEIAIRYSWTPRRLNPAIAYLRVRDVVGVLNCLGSGPYNAADVRKTDSTRRFVKSRS